MNSRQESESVTHALHLGCQGFNFNEWRGPFFPSRLKPGQFLSYYSSIFSFLELDTTYFVIPRQETVKAWNRQTPAEFKFSLLLPSVISADKGFRDCSGELIQFLEAITLLEEKLAPIVIKTPAEMDLSWLGDLSTFLDTLPQDFRCALDFTHPSWLCAKTYDMLRKRGHSLCLVDREDTDRELQLTADFIVIRMSGNKTRSAAAMLKLDRREDLGWYRNQIQALRRSTEVYLSCGNHWNGFAPDSLRQLQRALEQDEASYGEVQQDLFPFLALDKG